MAVYAKTERMVNDVIDAILTYRDLVGEKDESKAGKYGFTPGLGMTNEAIALSEQADNLHEGIFQVLFTGGFSSGKSTLLNALMRNDVLKTGINPETAVITKIIFNADEKVIVFKKSIDKTTGQQLTEEMSVEAFFERYRIDQENPELFADIDYVQLQQSQDGIGGSMVQMVDSPGTQNSKADDEAAHSFAKKASAIVYLVNATKPFEFDEKEYIKDHFEDKSLRNLFFIINRIDCVNDNEIDELKNNVRLQLKNVFTNDRGVFDEELFNNRVFYTNAYGSLCARTGKTYKVQGQTVSINDSETGVPQFEDALGRFLTDDNRDRDALAAYVPKMATIYVNAENLIKEQIDLYTQGLSKIKKDKAALDKAISKATNTISNIEADCKSTAQNVLISIKTAYDSYVNDVDSDWDRYFTENPVKMSMLDLGKTLLTRNEAARMEKLKPIQEAIKRYIDLKSVKLQSAVESIIKTHVDSLEQRLALYQEQLERLNFPIEVSDIITKIYAVSTDTNNANPQIKVNTFQLVLGLVGLDLDIAANAFSGTQTNTQAIVKSISANVLEYIALNVVSWPISLAILAKRAYDIVKSLRDGGNLGAKDMITKMKPGIIESLREGKKSLMMDLETQLSGAFIRAGATFAESFNNELESYKASFEEMLKNVSDRSFSLEQEQERTKKLLDEMVRVINNVCRLTMNRELNAAEIHTMSERNAAQ